MQLGVAMGIAATRFGRDKVTIIASPGIADLGAWLEQLLAESTGKQGRGLIPLADEPLGRPSATAATGSSPISSWTGGTIRRSAQAVAALERAGHPVARIGVKDAWHIGQEFFRWEIATAVAGAIIGINPFNQPDVEASKDKTRALTDDYEKSHGLPRQKPVFRENGIALLCRPAQRRRARPAQHADRLSEEPFRARARGASPAITSRCWPISSATRRTRRALTAMRGTHPRQDPRRDLPRLRAALPAFDRASLQRRAE